MAAFAAGDLEVDLPRVDETAKHPAPASQVMKTCPGGMNRGQCRPSSPATDAMPTRPQAPTPFVSPRRQLVR